MVFPDAVMQDEEGNKLVNYTAFTPVLTQSIKELVEEIEQLKDDVEFLKEENEAVKVSIGIKK